MSGAHRLDGVRTCCCRRMTLPNARLCFEYPRRNRGASANAQLFPNSGCKRVKSERDMQWMLRR